MASGIVSNGYKQADDLNTVGEGIVICRYISSTLHTPYKQGATQAAEGFVISCINGANYGAQLCCALGDPKIYHRYSSPNSWTTWKSLTPQ